MIKLSLIKRLCSDGKLNRSSQSFSSLSLTSSRRPSTIIIDKRIGWPSSSSKKNIIDSRKNMKLLFSSSVVPNDVREEDNDENGNEKYTKGSNNKDAISMNDYTYNLDINAIAKYPAYPRGSSRLLRVDEDGNVSHYENFTNSFLSLAGPSNTFHIVFNESKVVNARLSVVNNSDDNSADVDADASLSSSIEMMILDLGKNVNEKCNGIKIKVMLRKEGVQVGEMFTVLPAKGQQSIMDTNTNTTTVVKFKVTDVIGPWIEDEHSNGNGTECIVECIMAPNDDNNEGTSNNITLAGMLDKFGTVPIPPYLNREAEESDAEAYNNVYASGCGSVAAPTAGLHFTDELLNKIGSDNISFLSLHVGAGTFKPVVVEDARDHEMHAESFTVNVGEIRRIISSLEYNKKIIVVGTTSSRTLESLYWCGIKKLLNQEGSSSSVQSQYDGDDNNADDNIFTLGQTEWTELLRNDDITAIESLKAVVNGKSNDDFIRGQTSLMIVPGTYDFKVVDNLITNFHAPDSTLMLLVSAFLGSGSKVKSVYEDAQERGYRFLSYGDACFFSTAAKNRRR